MGYIGYYRVLLGTIGLYWVLLGTSSSKHGTKLRLPALVFPGPPTEKLPYPFTMLRHFRMVNVAALLRTISRAKATG